MLGLLWKKLNHQKSTGARMINISIVIIRDYLHNLITYFHKTFGISRASKDILTGAKQDIAKKIMTVI